MSDAIARGSLDSRHRCVGIDIVIVSVSWEQARYSGTLHKTNLFQLRTLSFKVAKNVKNRLSVVRQARWRSNGWLVREMISRPQAPRVFLVAWYPDQVLEVDLDPGDS